MARLAKRVMRTVEDCILCMFLVYLVMVEGLVCDDEGY